MNLITAKEWTNVSRKGKQHQLPHMPPALSWRERIEDALSHLKSGAFDEKDAQDVHTLSFAVSAGYWFSQTPIRTTLLEAGVITKIGRLDQKLLGTEFGSRIAKHVGGPKRHHLYLYSVDIFRLNNLSQWLNDAPELVSRRAKAGIYSGKTLIVPATEPDDSPQFNWYEKAG